MSVDENNPAAHKRTFSIPDNLPKCTCGKMIHQIDCPRYALKIRFEENHLVVLGPSEPVQPSGIFAQIMCRTDDAITDKRS